MESNLALLCLFRNIENWPFILHNYRSLISIDFPAGTGVILNQIINTMKASNQLLVIVLALFSISASAQDLLTGPCRANYVYVQGASNKVAFLNKSVGDYTNSEWAFGDGNVSTEKNAVHEYNSSGYYLLRLVVSNDNKSDSDTLYQIIDVRSSVAMNSYANKNNTNEGSFLLSARSEKALFDCFDKFFADATVVSPTSPSQKQKKVTVETSW